LSAIKEIKMIKTAIAVAMLTATIGGALLGSNPARSEPGIITNGTSLNGQTVVVSSSQVVGLVLPNGAAVSVR
jgi:hypothetical protein